ncbi:MAG: 16S rRNA (cytosine(1402)-N(4))-methyltransferase RsmH [Proteobacteria bacterium]|nr:16S rRNA (cytosine(1402)-N(4))-methyltransferase RsmH [Pseudomonadota bacterium]
MSQGVARVHNPVMPAEIVAALAPQAGRLYVDGTFGAGGYAEALLASCDCRVVGIDRDPDAVARGQGLERRFPGRLEVLEGRFGDMIELVRGRGLERVDGVALDLGVSSPQLDDPQRGFSFRADGPLDMRMERQGPSAADLVNGLSERALADLIFELGEERYARRIARAIVGARAQAPIQTTLRLAEIVRQAVPRAADGIDPATRTFQALRIQVNDELDELDRGLSAAENLLASGGRLAAVSFHSLEDRRVKQFMKARAATAAGGSRRLPGEEAPRPPSFRLLTRKALRPSAAEVAANPRARSARLRVAERTQAPAWPMAAGSEETRP